MAEALLSFHITNPETKCPYPPPALFIAAKIACIMHDAHLYTNLDLKHAALFLK
jgi:hypothetical protein